MARVLDNRVVDSALDVVRAEPGAAASARAGNKDHVTRRIATTRFGALEVDVNLVITFPEGLIGFETCREFVVIRHDDTGAFRWLQSLDNPGVAFPVAEPLTFRPDYAPTISDGDARTLRLRRDTPILLFAVVSVPGPDPATVTANLLAPLVINGESRQGRQVVIQDDGFTTRHGLIAELGRAATLPATGP